VASRPCLLPLVKQAALKQQRRHEPGALPKHNQVRHKAPATSLLPGQAPSSRRDSEQTEGRKRGYRWRRGSCWCSPAPERFVPTAYQAVSRTDAHIERGPCLDVTCSACAQPRARHATCHTHTQANAVTCGLCRMRSGARLGQGPPGGASCVRAAQCDYGLATM
jgi:hypothetical protein